MSIVFYPIQEQPANIVELAKDETSYQIKQKASNAIANPIQEIFALFAMKDTYKKIVHSIKYLLSATKTISYVQKNDDLSTQAQKIKELFKKLKSRDSNTLSTEFMFSKKLKLNKRISSLYKNLKSKEKQEEAVEKSLLLIHMLKTRAKAQLSSSLSELIGKICVTAGTVLFSLSPYTLTGIGIIAIGATVTIIANIARKLSTNKKEPIPAMVKTTEEESPDLTTKEAGTQTEENPLNQQASAICAPLDLSDRLRSCETEPQDPQDDDQKQSDTPLAHPSSIERTDQQDQAAAESCQTPQELQEKR